MLVAVMTLCSEEVFIQLLTFRTKAHQNTPQKILGVSTEPAHIKIPPITISI